MAADASRKTGRTLAMIHCLLRRKNLNPAWRTITLNISRDAAAPISAGIDTGTGGQPQRRTQYLLNRDTGAVVKTITFGQGSLGQKLRTFVRFGHTGEYGGLPGQIVAALASLGVVPWSTPAWRFQSGA